MKRFDIFYWQPPDWEKPHPCVVVSHPDRVARKDPVEVIACSTQRAQRKPEAHEIILDEADGLDWPTLCKCEPIYAAPRPELKVQKGHVTGHRQAPLVRTMIAAHGWTDVL
jgi:mRNA-degrading endonuclease toxin of MazEF toxin-antitoxin module